MVAFDSEIEGMVFFSGSDGSPGGAAAQERPVAPNLIEEDLALDRSLRPKRLSEYLGQTKVKESLAILIQAAQERGTWQTTSCSRDLPAWGRPPWPKWLPTR